MSNQMLIINIVFIGAVFSILTILNAFSGGQLW